MPKMFLIGVLSVLLLHSVEAVIVSVEQGLLEGEQKWTITGDTLYYSFKGIPYAAPPIGKLRFKAPEPPVSWEGTRNATVFGNVCPQFNLFKNIYTPGSEDCLFFNVYTPQLTPDEPLPVMFFIHGGGYYFGSGNDDNYGPDFLVKNVVLVTINYRLDTLGFLCLDSEDVPGNAGMKDQVAALKWVQKNIHKFGGDPKKVTIFGQSAGASSCSLLAISPMAEGLFQRVIAMSGAAQSGFSLEFEPQKRALVLSKSLGLESSNLTDVLEFFQSIPVRQLLYTNSSVIAAENYIDDILMVNFVPVVEKDFGQERFLIEPPNDSIKNGRIYDVDYLLGYTSAEGLTAINMVESRTVINYDRYPEVLVPRDIYYNIAPSLSLKLADSIKDYFEIASEDTFIEKVPKYVNYITGMYIYDVIRQARHLSKCNKNNNVYLYQFSYMSERNVNSQQGAKYGISGVAHSDELQYVFQANALNLPINTTDEVYKKIEQICSLLINFAATGNPTSDGASSINWPIYDTSSEEFVDIGEELTVDSQPMASMMEFWRSIYNQAGQEF